MLGTDYPYTSTDGECTYDSSKVIARPVNHTAVEANSPKALKAAIAKGPVSVAIEASSDVFRFYSTGVLNSKECGAALNHGVVAVGYGVSASKGKYYIVRNSWGADWGLKGYVKIAVAKGEGICGIHSMAHYPNF